MEPANRGVVSAAFRVGAGVLRDRIVSGRVYSSDRIPGSVSQMTPEWLTAVICDGVKDARVLDFEATHGDAGSSTRQGFALHLNEAAMRGGIPSHIFTKSAPGFVQRMFLGLTGAAEFEALFFREIRPSVDLEAPRAFYAAFDPVSFRCITLMNDLSVEQHAKFISIDDPITKPMMVDLLNNLARLHARFWQSAELGRNLRQIRTCHSFLAQMSRFIDFPKRGFLAMDRYSGLLPPGMSHQRELMWKATQATYERDLGMPETVLHGDAHIGQTYVTGSGKMGWSDWQLIQRGSWAADFAYAVTTGLTIEDRRAWEAELLESYLAALAEGGGPSLKKDHAWDEYRVHTLYPFFAWAFTRAGAGKIMPDMQPDALCSALLERTAHAVWDLDALGTIRGKMDF